ncbi:hypothetical protein [uncultured Eubacterium sp.]|uniref:hypothetical protein n=1 Tax=uncultured Eubacterium sp. TaxID=165185 RepID=UPI0034398937
MFDYIRVVVIGCPGAGKSTFSRKLHAVTNLPLFHLDALYWNKDCTHIIRAELIEKQMKIFATDSFIIDGNFISTLELRIKEADVVFLFDLPTETCIDGAKKRKGNKPEMPCQLPSNDELIDFIKRFNVDVMPKINELIEKYNSNVVTFHSHSEADEYIENLKMVTVKIDRPMGSFHPEHKDLFYPINYGYIEGLFAGDGEEQDAYILGIDEPVTEFSGKVIAVVHRTDDVEDKWIVVPDGVTFTVDEIEKSVDFQEKYFSHTIELI